MTAKKKIGFGLYEEHLPTEPTKGFKCELCGKTFKRVGSHLEQIHGVKPQDYYDRYLKQEGEGECMVCGKPTAYGPGLGLVGYRLTCSSECLSVVNIANNPKRPEKVVVYENECTCEECGEVFGYNKRPDPFFAHLREAHDMTRWQYYDKHMKKEGEGICLICGEPTNCKGSFFRGYNKYCSHRCSNKVNARKKWEKEGEFEYMSNIMTAKHKDPKFRAVFLPALRKATSSPEFAKNSRIRQIRRIEKQKLNGRPLLPCVGNEEESCLNILEEYLLIKIVRQKRVVGYFVDGYIEDANVVVEFYENQHRYKIERDEKRMQAIVKELGCVFFIIHEVDWIESWTNVAFCLFEAVREAVSRLDDVEIEYIPSVIPTILS